MVAPRVRRPQADRRRRSAPSRPAALRPGARPGGGVRRTTPVRRASAGPDARPGRGRPRDARRVPAACTARSAVRRVRRALGRRSAARPGRARTRSCARWRSPRARTCSRSGTDDLEQRIEHDPRRRGRRGHASRCPTRSGRRHGARGAARLGRSATRRYLVDAGGHAVRASSATTRREAAAELPLVSDAPRRIGLPLEVGDDARPGDARRRAAARLADAGRRRQRRRRPSCSGSTTRTASRAHAGPTAGPPCSASTRPTLRTTELVPGQVRLLRSLLARPRGARSSGSILADDDSGTYVPRPRRPRADREDEPEAPNGQPSHPSRDAGRGEPAAAP